jgi:hypothetical protein
MAGRSLRSKGVPVHDDSGSETESDLTCRQPSDLTEVAENAGPEVQVEENVEGVGQSQEMSGGEAEISAISENVNTETMKNPSIELPTMIWKVMQEEKKGRRKG